MGDFEGILGQMFRQQEAERKAAEAAKLAAAIAENERLDRLIWEYTWDTIRSHGLGVKFEPLDWEGKTEKGSDN